MNSLYLGCSKVIARKNNKLGSNQDKINIKILHQQLPDKNKFTRWHLKLKNRYLKGKASGMRKDLNELLNNSSINRFEKMINSIN